jgi:hypothetical protein
VKSFCKALKTIAHTQQKNILLVTLSLKGTGARTWCMCRAGGRGGHPEGGPQPLRAGLPRQDQRGEGGQQAIQAGGASSCHSLSCH